MRVVLLAFVLFVSGCVGLDSVAGTAGDALKFPGIGATIKCGNARIVINAATFENAQLTIAVENKGDVDLTGFDIVAIGTSGSVTTRDDSTIKKGQVETLTVVTADKPNALRVTSHECKDVKAEYILL